ncbi:CocE/NonD family hydrolase [Paraherbaspirillum soli]|uniref:CocE/NonD family hydrolase n=1 Tax=Paraherbaspirillum soli TaxID=631222 RepID=A0ABW0M6K1_9BURK
MRISSALPGLVLSLAFSSSIAHAELCRTATSAEAASYSTPMQSPGIVSPIDGTCWIPSMTVTSFDGTKLAANIFLPKRTSSDQKFPAILMIASWAAPGRVEYIGQQQRLAKDGYVVMSYTARGFWLSEGQVDVAAPADVRDVSSALDWMQANAPIDINNVATSGISYGAGLSLIALSQDPRIKTAAALSGWANLVDQLYPAGTPNKTWASILSLLGTSTGRPAPEVNQNIQALLSPDTPAAKIAEISAWAKARSPASYVAAINKRGAPVFISKNYQDDMFTPNSSLAMFAALTVPKKMLLNPGIHGSAELSGALLGLDNYPYDQAHRWFNHWLKGENNGIEKEPKLTMQVKFSDRRESFSNWPAPELSKQTYYLAPRGGLRFDWGCFCGKGDKGTISTAPNTATSYDLIQNLFDTTATSGLIPILSTLGETVNLPVINSLLTVSLAAGVRYEAPALAATQKIRGIPKLNLRVTPTQARAQVVAYLYDVDAIGISTLITHGASTLHWATPGQTIDFPIEMSAIAYDVPAGHHIGVVMDTADSLYASPVHPGERFGVRFEFNPNQQATLVLPTL